MSIASEIRKGMKVFRPIGPGFVVCGVCGWRGSNNALAKAAHLRNSKLHSHTIEQWAKAEIRRLERAKR